MGRCYQKRVKGELIPKVDKAVVRVHKCSPNRNIDRTRPATSTTIPTCDDASNFRLTKGVIGERRSIAGIPGHLLFEHVLEAIQ
jgi:hypothetical protein